MASRAKYDEGDVFAVPLRDRGFAVGVLARKDRSGIPFGYFFGPRFETVPKLEELSLDPRDAILIGVFGPLGFEPSRAGTEREWVVIGKVPDWDRDGWPLVPLVDESPFGDGVLIEEILDEEELSRPLETRRNRAARRNQTVAGVLGAGFVEIRLTSLLASP